MANHSRNAKTSRGHDLVLVKMATMKVRVGDDGSPCNLVECDVLGCEVGRTCDHHCMGYAFWIAQCPRERLHAAQAAAHDRCQSLNAQSIE